jgi:hypothetical protein
MLSAIVVTGLAGDRPGLSRLAVRSVTGGRWLIRAIAFPAVLFLMSTQTNVMGASLTLGALALVPVFGRENLARRARVVEPPPARRCGP